jgi:hypothetical protein
MATVKQKKAAKRMVENGGVASTAMLDVGYSPATAKTPSKLTRSEGFKEVWEELIPRSLVIKTHKKVIEKVDKDGQPHSDATKGIDMYYKVDGDYAAEKHLNMTVEVEAVPLIKALTERLNVIYGSAGVRSDGGESSIVGDKAQDKE